MLFWSMDLLKRATHLTYSCHISIMLDSSVQSVIQFFLEIIVIIAESEREDALRQVSRVLWLTLGCGGTV